MKAAALFAVIAALAILTGAYSTAFHRTERLAWQHQNDTLEGKVAQLEKELAEAEQDKIKRDRARPGAGDLDGARSDLAKLEAEILDRRAELTQLESDRVVADDHAKAALDTLQKQVLLSEDIEHDLKALRARRIQIKGRITQAEREVEETSRALVSRRAIAETLEKRIAELTIRHEVATARLKEAEAPETRQVTADLDRIKRPEAPPEPAPQVEQTKIKVAEQTPPEDEEPRDRTRGLYQFKRLKVDRQADVQKDEPIEQASLPALEDEEVKESEASSKWAAQQYDLGRELVSRGQKSSGTRQLDDAVLAFRAALGEWPKERETLRWASTHADMGYALALIGRRQENIGVLEQAAAACRKALAAIRQNETPLLWAAAQHNLGFALGGIAAIKEDQILWQNAIESFQRSIEVFETQGTSVEVGIASQKLKEAQKQLQRLREAAS